MSMGWVFWAFLGASIVHIFEEYKYPGGFPDYLKRANPRFATAITTKFAVVINGLQVVLCVAAMAVGDRNLIFSLSVAGLLLLNALMHIGGTIRTKHYVPGVISAGVIYAPLSLLAFYAFGRAGQISGADLAISLLLGGLYQAVPVAYLIWATRFKRSRTVTTSTMLD
jgi:hypothetical protein